MMMMKIIKGKKQRCWNCSTIKTLKQFLKNVRYVIDWLWNKSDLTLSEKCVLTAIITHAAVAAQGDNSARPAIRAPTNAAFKITDTTFYAPVVTLSTGNDKKFLEWLKSGFKRTIKWNKYRPEMINQAKTNNLNNLIDRTFNKANRLFVLSFEN